MKPIPMRNKIYLEIADRLEDVVSETALSDVGDALLPVSLVLTTATTDYFSEILRDGLRPTFAFIMPGALLGHRFAGAIKREMRGDFE